MAIGSVSTPDLQRLYPTSRFVHLSPVLSKAWRRPELGLAIPVYTTVFVYMVINFDSLDSASTGDYLLGR